VNARSNRNVFNWRLNALSLCSVKSCSSAGNAFHALGPACEKLRTPNLPSHSKICPKHYNNASNATKIVVIAQSAADVALLKSALPPTWGHTVNARRPELIRRSDGRLHHHQKSVLIAWSSRRWTGFSSGTSVIWSRSNWTESRTGYIPVLDCYLLTSWCWKCCITALKILNVNYFFVGWCEVWFIWNKQKQQIKCYTWTEFGTKNVPRPNRSDVGPETSRTRTWTCTNIRS